MKLLIIFFLACLTSFGQNTTKDSIVSEALIDPEIMAEYPGGTKAMLKYLRDSVMNKINITKDESYILRPVYSKITIDETGKVTNPKIIRSSNVASVDSLMMKALGNMPNWKPGSVFGKIKKQDFNIPLRFELKD